MSDEVREVKDFIYLEMEHGEIKILQVAGHHEKGELDCFVDILNRIHQGVHGEELLTEEGLGT